MATSGDFLLATNGDFLMAKDSRKVVGECDQCDRGHGDDHKLARARCALCCCRSRVRTPFLVNARRIRIFDRADHDHFMVGMEIARRWACCAAPSVEEATD
jgi:hypothetical protein